jgi:hypothetical protein
MVLLKKFSHELHEVYELIFIRRGICTQELVLSEQVFGKYSGV